MYSYTCNNCGYIFSTEEEFHKHNKRAHSDRYCTECRLKPFGTANDLNIHLSKSAVHNERIFACPGFPCERLFITRSDLVMHLEYGSCCSGIGRDRLNCIIACVDDGGEITLEYDEANYYYYYSDIGEGKLWETWNGYCFECPECNKSWLSVHGVTAHIRCFAHAPNRYCCPAKHGGCDKQFKAFSGLLAHLEMTDCGLRRYFKKRVLSTIFNDVAGHIESVTRRR
ncbi:hypothetical protein BDY19DRAFT_892783 [Irpex rosettiformis]|uniref:Uncharacterized protein n=1 Tax=Irpex rosettiformis TaxID=378272 RepID=A0ACB8TZR9_9APHY|nr:hypothetical protein BDY19DRAFT_892783 [Irpex rosettiformis]